MKKIKDIHESLQNTELLRVVIAGVTEEEIQLVKEALKNKMATFILLGDQSTINPLIEQYELGDYDLPVVHVTNSYDVPSAALELIKQGKADIPMKGQVHTSQFIKAILAKDSGFASGNRLSQITMFDGYNDELQFLTDCAINIDYSMKVKINLIENAVNVAKKFGKEIPKVALLGAVENVSEKMGDTIESAAITQMNRREQLKGCIVDGPLSLDNAISQDFAKLKGIESPVAGEADILVATSLNEANSLGKAIIHYAKKEACSIIAGTLKPIIMTSRTDTKSNKLNTISAACYMYRQ